MTNDLVTDPHSFAGFAAADYLEKYYSYVGRENAAWLSFVGAATRHIPARPVSLVEAGGGPSVAAVMALVSFGVELRDVRFIDIGARNLDAVGKWLRDDPTAFTYRAVLRWLADHVCADPQDAVEGARSVPWRLQLADIAEPNAALGGPYDVVSSHFFAESATREREEMVRLLDRVTQLGSRNSTVIFSFMRGSAGYEIGGERYPAVAVNEVTILPILQQAGLDPNKMEVSWVGAEDPPTRDGYSGMVFVSGRL